jgi:hypothetical protein
MTDFVCKFCKKQYKNNITLTTHIKKCKMVIENNEHKCNYCLKFYSSKYSLQKHLEKCKHKDSKEEENKCKYCNKNYTSIYNLKNHTDTCLHKKIYEMNKKYETLYRNYQNLKIAYDKIIDENAKNKPENYSVNTIINNYTTNNNHITLKQIVSKLEPICYDEIKSSMSNFTNDYIDDGIKGFARFLCDFGCNNKIVTTDNSRHTIVYRTKFDDFIRDPECLLLINNTLKNNSDEIIYKAEERRKYYVNHANYDSFSKRIMRIIDLRKLAEASVKEKPDDNIKTLAQMLCEHGLKTFHTNKLPITA